MCWLNYLLKLIDGVFELLPSVSIIVWRRLVRPVSELIVGKHLTHITCLSSVLCLFWELQRCTLSWSSRFWDSQSRRGLSMEWVRNYGSKEQRIVHVGLKTLLTSDKIKIQLDRNADVKWCDHTSTRNKNDYMLSSWNIPATSTQCFAL